MFSETTTIVLKIDDRSICPGSFIHSNHMHLCLLLHNVPSDFLSLHLSPLLPNHNKLNYCWHKRDKTEYRMKEKSGRYIYDHVHVFPWTKSLWVLDHVDIVFLQAQLCLVSILCTVSSVDFSERILLAEVLPLLKTKGVEIIYIYSIILAPPNNTILKHLKLKPPQWSKNLNTL